MGKLGKYYEENCLMQQAFVKENKVSVEKHVVAVAKEVGGSIQIKGFYRFERGEGLERRKRTLRRKLPSSWDRPDPCFPPFTREINESGPEEVSSGPLFS